MDASVLLIRLRLVMVVEISTIVVVMSVIGLTIQIAIVVVDKKTDLRFANPFFIIAPRLCR